MRQKLQQILGLALVAVLVMMVVNSALAGNARKGRPPAAKKHHTTNRTNQRPLKNLAAPKVFGSPVVGQWLAATPGTWSNAHVSIGYAWYRCDGSAVACQAEPQESSSSYVLRTGDVGHALRVVVTATGENGSATAVSSLTATIAPAPVTPPTILPQAPLSTTVPVLSGSLEPGQTVVGSSGTWSGTSPLTFTNQWERGSATGDACVPVIGATAPIYTLGAQDVGSTLLFEVRGTNGVGSSTADSLVSPVVAPVPTTAPGTTSAPTTPPTTTTTTTTTTTSSSPSPATMPVATAAPAIRGTAQQGQTLSASNGSWTGATPMTYSYGWERCDASGSSCNAIGGATASTYVSAAADVGATVRVVVSAANGGGAASATSAATAVVTAPSSPAPAPTQTTTTSTTPPASTPPVSTPSSGFPTLNGEVGVNANVAGYGVSRQQAVLASGIKLIREDRGDYAVAWAHANGINCIGLIFLNPDSPGTACNEIELDNEPYWTSEDPRVWAQQADAVAKTLRARGITKPLLLPLLAFSNDAALGSGIHGNGDFTYDGVTKPFVEWVNEGAPDIWQYVDGFSIHPYSPKTPWTPTAMNDVRAELQAIPAAANKPFWITEFGWATGGNPSGDWDTSEANQASWLASAIDQMKARSDVAAIVLYQFEDLNTNDTTTSEDHYGLLHSDGSPKPAYGVVEQRLG